MKISGITRKTTKLQVKILFSLEFYICFNFYLA